VTKRLAVVGLDWSIFTVQDLWCVFSGFVPAGGSIKDITVYFRYAEFFSGPASGKFIFLPMNFFFWFLIS
jgi:hypothetical protein